MLLLGAHALRRALLDEIACHELDRRIALTGGLQLFERGQAFQGHLVQANLGVQAEGRLQFLRLQRAAGQLVEPRAEGIHVQGLNGYTCRHCVAAVPNQQVRALAQSRGQVKTGDASA